MDPRSARRAFAWVYRSPRWRKVRARVLKRDGWTCTCGRWGNTVHHTRPLHKHPEQDPYDAAGLRTICRDCHRRAHEDQRAPCNILGRDEWFSALRARLR